MRSFPTRSSLKYINKYNPEEVRILPGKARVGKNNFAPHSVHIERGNILEEKIINRLRKTLPENLYAGVKFQYREYGSDNFAGAVPDFYYLLPSHIVLGEIKLSFTTYAFRQMENAYVPILELYYKRPVTTIQVYQNVLDIDPRQFYPELSLVEAQSHHREGKFILPADRILRKGVKND